MAGKKKYADFESAMSRLQEVTALLESGECKLEEAIELYTEGLDIVKFCDEKLSEAESKIKLIAEQNGQLVEKELDEGNSEE